LDQNIDKRVKNIFRISLDRSEMRVSIVGVLLGSGLFHQAVDQSLPLIGTKHMVWFLYARAWQQVENGAVQDAERILAEVYKLLNEQGTRWSATGFSFTEQGLPKLHPPFNYHVRYREATEAMSNGEADLLDYPTAMFQEDWLALLTDINHNIREYKTLFRNVAACLEKVLHHEIDTLGAAVGALDLEEDSLTDGSSFLLMAFMSHQHLQMTADTLWRICADWNFPQDLCEITSFLHYLLEDDPAALDLAERGLNAAKGSLLCGNVRALILNRAGQAYLADEQWRETLSLNPDRSATYLVLGHQALCAGGLEPALRYFQEAVVLGDNAPEAYRFLNSALEGLN